MRLRLFPTNGISQRWVGFNNERNSISQMDLLRQTHKSIYIYMVRRSRENAFLWTCFTYRQATPRAYLSYPNESNAVRNLLTVFMFSFFFFIWFSNGWMHIRRKTGNRDVCAYYTILKGISAFEIYRLGGVSWVGSSVHRKR